MNLLQVLIQRVMTRRNLCKHLPTHYVASYPLQGYCITLTHACTWICIVVLVGGIYVVFLYCVNLMHSMCCIYKDKFLNLPITVSGLHCNINWSCRCNLH